MVLFNYSTRELTAKVVYYGPGLCGKTTNLQYIHDNLPENVKGKMLSLATKTDRTLFFDFLPIDLGEIRGMKTRVQLYTVPGQVFYNETRKLVLKGADGIVFVADSQETMLGANVESYRNLEENLKAHGMKLGDMPHVIQFNKRDLPRLAGIEDLNGAINRFNAPFYESVATTGIGVQDTLKAIVKLVLLHLTRKYDPKAAPVEAHPPAVGVAMAEPPRVAAMPAPTPAPEIARPSMTASIAAPSAAEPVRKARPAPPPPPDFRGGGAVATFDEAMPLSSFDESEIESLVGEVAEIEEPPIVLESEGGPEVVAEPVAAAPAADDGIWMGEPDTGVEPSAFAPPEAAFGATLSLDDMEAKLASAPTRVPAPPAFGEEGFEIDRGFDPEWQAAGAAPAAPARPTPPSATRVPVRHVEPVIARSEPVIEPLLEPIVESGSSWAADEPSLESTLEPEATDVPVAPLPIPAEPFDEPEQDVVLTEVAAPSDLFDDPSLEVASLAPGEAREIVVPVELGEGAAVRRFKLAIRLRLDPLD